MRRMSDLQYNLYKQPVPRGDWSPGGGACLSFLKILCLTATRHASQAYGNSCSGLLFDNSAAVRSAAKDHTPRRKGGRSQLHAFDCEQQDAEPTLHDDPRVDDEFVGTADRKSAAESLVTGILA